MKKIIIIILFIILIGVLLVIKQCTPDNGDLTKLEIVSSTFSPPYITTGRKPLPVTVSLKIADSQLIASGSKIIIHKIETIHDNKISLPVGTLLDDGKQLDKVANDNVFTGTILVQQKFSGEVFLQATAFESYKPKAKSDPFAIIAGAVVKAGKEGSVESAEGISLSIPANAVNFDAFLSVNTAPKDSISAPIGKLSLGQVVKIIVKPTVSMLEGGGITKPFTLKIPVSKKLTSNKFLVAKEISVPISNEKQGGIFKRLTPVDNAVLNQKTRVIETRTKFYKGIRSSGLYVILDNLGSDDISGEVCEGNTEPCPSNAAKATNVIVSTSSNTLVAVTDEFGVFQLHISGNGESTLHAFDFYRGFSGDAVVDLNNLKPSGEDVALSNTFFASGFAPSFAGVRNGGFECIKTDGNLCDGYWGSDPIDAIKGTGDIQIIDKFAICPSSDSGDPSTTCTESSTGARLIKPSEGDKMVSLSTGQNASGEIGTALAQRIKVPNGATHLYFDYIFLSEEFNEWVGSKFDDSFKATLINQTDRSTINIVDICINDIGRPEEITCPPEVPTGTLLPPEAIFDCGFPEGDRTCGKSPFVLSDRNATIQKWETASVDISAFAGTSQYLDLTFTTNDNGDNIYDTLVLLDNIRFNTVFLDVKVIQNSLGTNALPSVRTDCGNPTECIKNDLVGFTDDTDVRRYGANEILSQAGINLRLRTNTTEVSGQQSIYKTITVDGAFNLNASDVGNVSNSGLIMLENRSPGIIENGPMFYNVNMYYVNTVNNNNTNNYGYAFTIEDHFNISDHDHDGIAVAASIVNNPPCLKTGATLAHELGHILISDLVNSSNEHEVSDNNNFMRECGETGHWPGINAAQTTMIFNGDRLFLGDNP